MTQSKQLFTHISKAGQLSFSLNEVEVSTPKSHEVIVRVEAAPINPSDMWPMFGPSDLSAAQLDGSTLTAPLFPGMVSRVSSRLDQTLPVGNEGAGTVVEAGDSPEAQALLGKTVAILCGAAYAQYCTTAQQAASSFVNPLTALGMVDTMRMEGHKALIHTAAASNLGQMLNKICISEDVPLVNVVRKDSQVALLNELGASYVVNSSADSFNADLLSQIEETDATLAFDAIGGDWWLVVDAILGAHQA